MIINTSVKLPANKKKQLIEILNCDTTTIEKNFAENIFRCHGRIHQHDPGE